MTLVRLVAMVEMEPSRAGAQGSMLVEAQEEAYLAWGYGIAVRGFRYSTPTAPRT
jgi:hypothetical protein